jgi:glycerol-3-phosphate cytidylyltransferase
MKKRSLKRVYCCGVFDLFHIGHMKLFEKIVKSFEDPIHLIVGVHSDEDVKSYKRKPILDLDTRAKTISYCKYVNEIIVGADLITTREFIEKKEIDCVIIGEEYRDNGDSKWYGDAIEMNIHKYISRYEELCTESIIKSCIKYYSNSD